MLTNQDTMLADVNAEIAAAAAPAELMVAQIYVLPETIQTTDAITFGADVRNGGEGEAGAFQARFTLSTGEANEIAYPPLRPGESHWEEWQHAPLSAGDYTFTVELDVYNQIQEGNQYDNAATLSFHIAAAELLDDSNIVLSAANELLEEEMPALESDDSGRKKKKVKTLDFSDEPEVIQGDAFKLPTGSTGPEYIQVLVQDLKHLINLYWNSYRDGLANFETRMSFSSDQEAEAKYLQAVFKAVAKEALGMALAKLGEEMGGQWGKIITVCKAAVEAWAAEKERAENAQGEVKIADYIEDIRNGITVQQNLMFKAVDDQRAGLLEEFNNTGADHPQHNKVGANGEIYGPQATLVRQLKQHVDAFGDAIPGAPYFQAEFTERFANTPGWTDLISHGARLAGMLYYSMSLYKDGNDWTLKDSADHWNLVTKAPKPERLATSLERSLQAEGKKPYQSDLPKMVQFNIEIEESGLNSYIDGYIHFTSDPDNYDVRTNYGDQLFREAWAIPAFRNHALKVVEIEGSND